MRTWENGIRFLILTLLFSACQEEESPLFILKKEAAPFNNELAYTEEFNPYTYRNFYNGGGVALGDINNDGLVDIYYTCLLYTSPSPRDLSTSRMPSSA